MSYRPQKITRSLSHHALLPQLAEHPRHSDERGVS